MHPSRKPKFTIYSIVIVICIQWIGLPEIYSQEDTIQTNLNDILKITIAAESTYLKTITKELRITKRINRSNKLRLSPEDQLKFTTDRVMEKYKLRDFFNGLTEESKSIYIDFFNEENPYGKSFEEYYEQFADSTFSSILEYNERMFEVYLSELENVSFTKGHNCFAVKSDLKYSHLATQSRLDPTSPVHGTSQSRMLIRKEYNGEYRDIVSEANQNLSLYGRYTDSDRPYYPDYDNLCKNCCGPAAGQSLLEWHNVPVRNESGNELTKPKKIQERLADQMNTRHKLWGTRFRNFFSTMLEEEYLQDKLVCVRHFRLPITIADLEFQLSTGEPMVFEIWNGSMLHYVTAYGLNDGIVTLANSAKTYTLDEFLDASLWKGMSRVARWALFTVGEFPGCAFSYTYTGTCFGEWDYIVPMELTDFFGNDPDHGWNEKYFDAFNQRYDWSDESGQPLNFNGYATLDFTSSGLNPLIKITSGGYKIKLAPGNSHVINYPVAQTGPPISNNSVGNPIDARVLIDTFFFDNTILNPAVFWFYIDRDGNNVKATRANIDKTVGANYVFIPKELYDNSYHRLVFSYHDGFRKRIWELLPCENDCDDDGICDEYEDDKDNDGILNENDNCPCTPNTDQIDLDGNGIGYKCDCDERCNMALCNSAAPDWLPCLPCNEICYINWSIDAQYLFLEHLHELYNWVSRHKIILEPIYPYDVIRGKFAYWLLNRKIDRVLKEFNTIVFPGPTKDEIVRSLVIPQY